jgi:hypothetical protein
MLGFKAIQPRLGHGIRQHNKEFTNKYKQLP